MSMRVGLGIASLCAFFAAGCASLSQRECERLGTCEDGGIPSNRINLSVATPRLARNTGGALELRSTEIKANDDVTVRLSQGMVSTTLQLQSGDVVDGAVKTNVAPGVLSMFMVGPVDVAASVGGKSGSGKVYLYVAPKFDPEAVLDYGAGTAAPVRVGISQRGLILVWERYTTLQGAERRRVGEYSLDRQSGKPRASSTLSWLSNPQVDFAFGATAQVGFARSDVAVVYPVQNQTNFGIIRCKLVEANPPNCATQLDSGVAGVTLASLEPAGSLLLAQTAPGLRGFQGDGNAPATLGGAPTGALLALAVGDLSGDAINDILAVASDGTATVLVGKDGAYAADATLSGEVGNRLKTAGTLSALTVADVDGDGLPDLALVAKASPKEVRVAFNLGGGKFQDAAAVSAPSTGTIADLASGDVDGDNDNDLVVVATAERRLGLFINKP